MSPKHIDNITDPQRRARAPYNFVELPEKVVEAEALPDGDRYHLDRHTGRIECTLTTKSKLYTRCGWNPEDFAEHSEKAFKELSEEIKNKRSNFFINPATQQLLIPGSSIRGMLRTLVEIVSFSKIDRVTENKLFYRSLGDPALKDIYHANFVDDLGKVQNSSHSRADCHRAKAHAGFLRKHGNYYVIEECGYGRIDRHPTKRVIPNLPNQPNLPTKPLYQGSGPGKAPSWTYQYQIIYVDIDSSEQDYFFPQQINSNGRQRHPDLYLRFREVHSASFTPAPELQKGTLVITGDMQHKHLEFVFLDEKLKEYSVTEEMVRRFQDDDQITKWQKDAYSKDKPSRACRQQDGYLRDGEPVFFLLNDDGEAVRFFGRAQMFRLPYEHSPLKFVPPKLRDASRTDIAEAIFGYVNGKEPRVKTGAGRVFISDGTLNPNQEEKVKPSLDKNPEQILLSSPKPTTFQHYLVQPNETEARQNKLKHYASQPPTDTEAGETVIRGHKLYWHKPCKIEVPENSDTQTSLIKPLDPEIEFTFTIYFENLSNVELGALLWVLSLSSDKSEILQTGKQGEKYCFSLGMGKPLGMGAVKIDYELHLSDRTARYSQLFNGDGWSQDDKEQDEVTQSETNCISEFEKYCISEFEKYVLDRISENDYPDKHNRQLLEHLRQIPRIEMLLAMLRCDSPSEAPNYMKLEEFKNRKVLPTPLDIRKVEDKPRFPTDSTSSSKTVSKPQKKAIAPPNEIEKPVNLALQRGATPTQVKPKPKLKLPQKPKP
ncbi:MULTISPECIES: TIGR03986 family type III CRISPR-associated RAMP protein [Kamptonema]|uniref:TIGR03986 family type III CRISPR-associated RAMP protein n=1 Tax=Kamptonema TaxID=1501433 RepID=UPI0001DAC5F8|nr:MULTISPECIES: TIGR03986 family CRISPR-associated RAMP protein [Kamptonema]CBN58543.1 conserved hypothetical protein [Kamptonema sp. PCC 6506]